MKYNIQSHEDKFFSNFQVLLYLVVKPKSQIDSQSPLNPFLGQGDTLPTPAFPKDSFCLLISYIQMQIFTEAH